MSRAVYELAVGRLRNLEVQLNSNNADIVRQKDELKLLEEHTVKLQIEITEIEEWLKEQNVDA